jgi:hypothetical protein
MVEPAVISFYIVGSWLQPTVHDSTIANDSWTITIDSWLQPTLIDIILTLAD